MAHEIMEYDDMFSVREVPWHGLGKILKTAPSIPDAIVASGLTWKVTLEKMTVPMHFNGQDQVIAVPDIFAVVRDDNYKVIGTVGNRYTPYQNDEMWSFIETFQKESGMTLETAGSLRNGRTTWVLAKNATTEYITGDPVKEFFLFRNSFDGSSPITVMFTNIRVVCNNTLSLALSGADNHFNVRHTTNASEQIKEVHKALGFRKIYKDAVDHAMDRLTRIPFTEKESETFIKTAIFPERKVIVPDNVTFGKFKIKDEATNRVRSARDRNVETIMELIECGAGTDIPGVKGTAWGLYNALTEWADHEKPVRVMNGRVASELRFENAFFGTASKFKIGCFDAIMKVAS